jgi:hypothetical protein
LYFARLLPELDLVEAPDLKLDRPVRDSPTFVVNYGVEIKRIEDYPG